MIILKVKKKQGFTLSLENIFRKKHSLYRVQSHLLVFKGKTLVYNKKSKSLLAFSCQKNAESRCLIRSSRPQIFFKICRFKNFSKYAGKHTCAGVSFFIKLQALELCQKKDSGEYRCFLANFVNFLRTCSGDCLCRMSALYSFFNRESNKIRKILLSTVFQCFIFVFSFCFLPFFIPSCKDHQYYIIPQ